MLWARSHKCGARTHKLGARSHNWQGHEHRTQPAPHTPHTAPSRCLNPPTRTHTHAHSRAPKHTPHTQPHTHTQMHTHTRTHTHTNMHMHKHTCACTCASTAQQACVNALWLNMCLTAAPLQREMCTQDAMCNACCKVSLRWLPFLPGATCLSNLSCVSTPRQSVSSSENLLSQVRHSVVDEPMVPEAHNLS